MWDCQSQSFGHHLRCPGSAQNSTAAAGRGWALQPARRASCRDNSPLAKRAPMVCTLPLSSPSFAGSVAPPGTSTVAMLCCAASAIMVAGSPLSQLATPITAFASGREPNKAAHYHRCVIFGYGSESNIPALYPEYARHKDRRRTRHRAGHGWL